MGKKQDVRINVRIDSVDPLIELAKKVQARIPSIR